MKISKEEAKKKYQAGEIQILFDDETKLELLQEIDEDTLEGAWRYYCRTDFGNSTIPILPIIKISEIEEESEVKDFVNHPNHYGGENNTYEVIKIIEAHDLNFSRGSAVKYTLRAGKKNPEKEIEDLEKAVWCLQREILKLKGCQQ